jgi:phage repressor protein C with HTH and peptisase S24 domain
MLSHEQLWRGIDLLAEDRGWSLTQLALCAGLDSTALNPSKRESRDGKPRWLSTATLNKVLVATGTSLCDFSRIIEQDERRSLCALRFDRRSIDRRSFDRRSSDR